jgi:predicted acyltransferase (DUF342 family)
LSEPTIFFKDGIAMVFDNKTLVIPEGTQFEEHTIVTKGDAIISDHSVCELGVITDSRIFIGEKVKIKGSITAENDIRIDLWSEIDGDIVGGKDVYLADKVKVKGKLSVKGNLDLSDTTDVQKFEAKGWINIRNPISLLIYIFLYMMELMRQGRSQEVELILNELEEEDVEFQISDVFLFIPEGTKSSVQETIIKGNCRIGAKCRILGNFTAHGNAKIEAETELFGSLKARDDVDIRDKVIINGNIECKGKLVIGKDVLIKGGVKAESVEMYKSAVIEGSIQAPKSVSFIKTKPKDVEMRIERYERGVEELDAVLD